MLFWDEKVASFFVAVLNDGWRASEGREGETARPHLALFRLAPEVFVRSVERAQPQSIHRVDTDSVFQPLNGVCGGQSLSLFYDANPSVVSCDRLPHLKISHFWPLNPFHSKLPLLHIVKSKQQQLCFVPPLPFASSRSCFACKNFFDG